MKGSATKIPTSCCETLFRTQNPIIDTCRSTECASFVLAESQSPIAVSSRVLMGAGCKQHKQKAKLLPNFQKTLGEETRFLIFFKIICPLKTMSFSSHVKSTNRNRKGKEKGELAVQTLSEEENWTNSWAKHGDHLSSISF